MKWLKFDALFGILLLVSFVLVDLLLLDKVYSHKLLLDWIVKTLLTTGLMAVFMRPGKK